MSIGEKRNKLLEMSRGKYVAFVDDDDDISIDYIKLLLEAAQSHCDCASLKGEYSVDGVFDGIFEHSLKYDKWETTNDEIKYLRFPNHLNMIRSNIAKQFKFPEKNFSEDFDWSTEIHKSGLLKTEYYIPEILYFYNFISKK
jgi:glycosyltransferase involved in cell wall biosynthesis